jgi:hypothetical protein
VCTTTRSLRRNSPACRDDTPRRASWLWAGGASFLCHSPALWVRPVGPPCGSALWVRPVGPPFGTLTYPVGRVDVIHGVRGMGILRSSPTSHSRKLLAFLLPG